MKAQHVIQYCQEVLPKYQEELKEINSRVCSSTSELFMRLNDSCEVRSHLGMFQPALHKATYVENTTSGSDVQINDEVFCKLFYAWCFKNNIPSSNK